MAQSSTRLCRPSWLGWRRRTTTHPYASSFRLWCAYLLYPAPMAKHGNLQSLIEYASARTVLAVLGSLPLSAAMKVGRAMGRVAYASASRLRRTGKRNLDMAFPEKSEAERNRILRACFGSLGRELGIFSKFATAPPKSLLGLVYCEGLEHLE